LTQSAAVVPVRTKKRFTPPSYEPKYKTEKEFLEYARKAGLVIPPERLDRPIHVACTGEVHYFWDLDPVPYLEFGMVWTMINSIKLTTSQFNLSDLVYIHYIS
jgi:hypothetical protein